MTHDRWEKAVMSASSSVHADTQVGGCAAGCILLFMIYRKAPRLSRCGGAGKRLVILSLTALALCASVAGPLRAQRPVTRRDAVTADTLRGAEVRGRAEVSPTRSATPFVRLDSAALQRRAVASMTDALRLLPGVVVRDYGGAGGLKTVSVRGLGAAHTTVVYNGLPLADTQNGQTDLSRFALGRLTAISLATLDAPQLLVPVRSLGTATLSLSTLEAAPATATDASAVHPARPLHGSVALRQGSFSAYGATLALRYRPTRRTTATLGGDWSWARNDYPFTVVNGVATAHLRRQNSRMQTVNAEGVLATRFDHGSLTTTLSFDRNHRRLPGQVIYYVNGNNERLTSETALAQTYGRYERGPWQAFAAFKASQQRSLYDKPDAQYPGGLLSQHYAQREAYLTAGLSYQPHRLVTLAWATDYAHNGLRSEIKGGLVASDAPVRRDTWLTVLSVRLGAAWWEVTARAQTHRHRDHLAASDAAASPGSDRITPSLTASAALWQGAKGTLRLRAGWKEGFRPPTFTELYYYHLGSSTLRPERTRQFSGGLTLALQPSLRWWPVLTFTADAYHSRVLDRIMAIPYTLYLWRMVNRAEVRTTGLDLTLTGTLRLTGCRGDQRLTPALNYSLQQARDLSEPGTLGYGRQPVYTPRHSGTASLAWESPWLSAAARLTFSSERWTTEAHVAGTRLPSWQEWGFTLWRTLALGARHRLTLRADLVNAFDRRYEVIARYPMPGRAYRVEATWHF